MIGEFEYDYLDLYDVSVVFMFCVVFHCPELLKIILFDWCSMNNSLFTICGALRRSKEMGAF